ncbi:DNA-directed RNA polymerase subunit A [Halobacteriales archaeon QS_4_70_19]|nr:MAG: DNA-directed RNA polymerase subunit A [Halobacteriales archaeon QS_4_70_19]
MTEFDVSDDVEAIVEDTDLPRRLKNEVYEAVESRDVPLEKVDEIAQAVESRYLETRVDPLDPVGTVSAQSIGEPGTQMSLDEAERVLIRRDGKTDTVRIGPLVDSLLESSEQRELDDHEVALAPDGLEVLSLGSDETVQWKTVEEVSRHTAPDELLEIELESGREIQATKAHSFVTRQENEIVPVAGEDLDVGDWLPVIGEFDSHGPGSVNLKRYLSSSDYWFTSALTDGGDVESRTPSGPEQTRNKRSKLETGELQEATAYPVQGTVGLPEQFPLDEETGFFIGAWLAKGSTTDRHTSISNTDPAFQTRIREFGDRFDLAVTGYESSRGFAKGYDMRLNGKVLSEFLDAACRDDDGNRIVPSFAFGAPEVFVKGLLCGYFSGDGNVAKNAIRAASTSSRLATGIGLLLSRVGVYGRFGENKNTTTLRIPKKFVPRFAERVGLVGERKAQIEELAADVQPDDPDVSDQIPNFGDALEAAATTAGIPQRQVNSATKRQRIGRRRLKRLVGEIERLSEEPPAELGALERAVEGDVVWERIERIEPVEPTGDYVYDLSVAGLETFTTAEGVVTHNTMNTFHYAGVAEIDVTQGLPRLIELVDARKTPDTPMMTVHLEGEYAVDRERAHEVVWGIEATRILALGDVSTNVADMIVRIDLNEDTLHERWPTVDDTAEIVGEIADTIESKLGVETSTMTGTDGSVIEFGPEDPSYRELLQQVEELRDIVFKGIDEVSRVVIRKEEIEDEEIAADLDADEEFVLYTEGSAFGQVLDIEGVDASRTTCNNIHEIYRNLGVEAAREAIIEETMNTLEEQGLDDVNIRHLMLVADIMTNRGTVESIGRHGISGNKQSVLARAAFEVTVNHLLDAAIHGEVDDLNGVTENVIVGKPIKLGTGDVNLRMGAKQSGSEGGPADD